MTVYAETLNEERKRDWINPPQVVQTMTTVNNCLHDGVLQRAASDGNIVGMVAPELRRPNGGSGALEVHQVNCECCGLSEECTPGYITRVKELFCGHWICGLCAEAVKEERQQMGRGTAVEDAVRTHMAACLHFNKLDRTRPAICLANGLRQLLRKNLEAQATGGIHSKPSSPRGRKEFPRSSLTRSSSCIPAMAREA